MLETILQHLPSGSEFASAIPVILSLIVIEGLLSVDNAMAMSDTAILGLRLLDGLSLEVFRRAKVEDFDLRQIERAVGGASRWR